MNKCLLITWWFGWSRLEQGFRSLQFHSPVQRQNERNQNRIPFKRLIDTFHVILLRTPLMEPLRGDESCPRVAVPEVTGLPPGVILHADNLEDVAPFKGYGCILARNGGILVGIVVKKSSHKELRKENHSTFLTSNEQTGDKGNDALYFTG